ncbi:MAG: nuclear transport factor 2 family protein [Sphingobium sp.]
MNRFFMAFLATGGLALVQPGIAQTTDSAKKSLVPLGMIADRGALTAMDYIEIQQLYARYAASLDFGDGASRETTFTTGGYYANLPSGHKPVYVKELSRRTTATGNVGERHLVTNLIITPTKEGADGFAYLIMIDRHGKPHTGFYNDKLVKTPDGWRFVGRHGWYDIDPDSPYYPKPEAPADAEGQH